jgi:hypothetical protein
MLGKSRRKRVRARERARGDRPPLCAPHTGKGPLFNWSQAGVRDLIALQRAISTGRLSPDSKGQRILDLVCRMFGDYSMSDRQIIEAARAVIISTYRAERRSDKLHEFLPGIERRGESG